MPLTFQTVARQLGFVKHDQVNNIKTGAFVLYTNFYNYKLRALSDEDPWYRSY
jgi:hypothetical protein